MMKKKLDETIKLAEEKFHEYTTKEKLEEELQMVKKQIEKVNQSIKDEDNLKIVKEKLNQLKSKLEEKDIHLSDFEKLVEESLQKIENELEKHVDLEKLKSKSKDVSETIQLKVNKAMEKIESQLNNLEPNERDKETIEARSRLKILDMVEKKIITAEEGEKLIRAMEKRNAGE